jgi:hypothetical protein
MMVEGRGVSASGLDICHHHKGNSVGLTDWWLRDKLASCVDIATGSEFT